MNNKGYCTEKHVQAVAQLGILTKKKKTYSPICNYVHQDVQISLDDMEEILKK